MNSCQIIEKSKRCFETTQPTNTNFIDNQTEKIKVSPDFFVFLSQIYVCQNDGFLNVSNFKNQIQMFTTTSLQDSCSQGQRH